MCSRTWCNLRSAVVTWVSVSVSHGTYRHINDLYTAPVDRMIVVTVGNCLRLTLNWSSMFVFILMQRCTHVDTVQQKVLNTTVNSKYICWSHIVKVLGSRVTFVRRNSVAVVPTRYTFVDMKLWSRMFAVNVQSVSVQQLNWDFIIQYIQNTNCFPVVRVIDCVTHVQLLSGASAGFWLGGSMPPCSLGSTCGHNFCWVQLSWVM